MSEPAAIRSLTVRPVTGAAHFAMLDVDMGAQADALPEVRPGRYRRNGMPLLMVGNRGVTFQVTPRRGGALLVHARRPREWMSRRRDPRLLIAAALVALAAAFAAVLIVALLVRAVLGG